MQASEGLQRRDKLVAKLCSPQEPSLCKNTSNSQLVCCVPITKNACWIPPQSFQQAALFAPRVRPGKQPSRCKNANFSSIKH